MLPGSKPDSSEGGACCTLQWEQSPPAGMVQKIEKAGASPGVVLVQNYKVRSKISLMFLQNAPDGKPGSLHDELFYTEEFHLVWSSMVKHMARAPENQTQTQC
ncbi:hypothetical protein AVEN_107456-1 [Araneus ventricosus]|uniref:Uncharacterized protein n=1 Tax=Araneus ventricosus TaxID=182803 RepID=A0A4Y2G9W5_ARAVE|nr:hypothetical protein AVEN_107456-1 [Araneus ventricosus]